MGQPLFQTGDHRQLWSLLQAQERGNITLEKKSVQRLIKCSVLWGLKSLKSGGQTRNSGGFLFYNLETKLLFSGNPQFLYVAVVASLFGFYS